MLIIYLQCIVILAPRQPISIFYERMGVVCGDFIQYPHKDPSFVAQEVVTWDRHSHYDTLIITSMIPFLSVKGNLCINKKRILVKVVYIGPKLDQFYTSIRFVCTSLRTVPASCGNYSTHEGTCPRFMASQHRSRGVLRVQPHLLCINIHAYIPLYE